MWIKHRVSYLLLLPMTLWALFVMMPELGQFFVSSQNIGHDIKLWVRDPINGIPLVVWVVCLLYHGMTSIHTMIEDYISVFWLHKLSLFFLRIISFGLMGLAIFSIVYIWMS